MMEQSVEFPELWFGKTDVPSASIAGVVTLALADYFDIDPSEVDITESVDVVRLDETFSRRRYGESVEFVYNDVSVSISPTGLLRFFDIRKARDLDDESTE